MSTLVLDTPRVTTLSKGWIISKRDDLIWLVGGSLVGYFALLAFSAGVPILTLYLVWSLLIDGPHLSLLPAARISIRVRGQGLG